jgi:Zn-dependent alcohol dehydrogenase
MKKQSVVNVVKELPAEFDMDELMEKLIVIEKIETALQEVKNGKTISHQQMKKEMKKWAK